MGCEKFIKEKIATLPTIPKSPEDRSNIGVVYFYTFLKT
jgi:hypothetical protein